MAQYVELPNPDGCKVCGYGADSYAHTETWEQCTLRLREKSENPNRVCDDPQFHHSYEPFTPTDRQELIVACDTIRRIVG